MMKNYVKEQKRLENILLFEIPYYGNKHIIGTCLSSANALHATTNPDVCIYILTDIRSHVWFVTSNCRIIVVV